MIMLSLTATGCGVKKFVSSNLRTGLILQYKLPIDQIRMYRGVTDVVQSQEMMGKPMETTLKIDTGYSIKGTGVDDQNNLMTRVVIESLNIAISSIQGNVSPDTSGLSGKSFGVTYSPEGKELKVAGIEKLPKIGLGMGDERSVKEFFSDLLPVLPDTAVKMGDSWTTSIEKNVQQGPLAGVIRGEATNVLEGIETLQGMECAVIKTRTESTVKGSGIQMGRELNITGVIREISTSYFAYKEGLVVKKTSDESTDLNIDAGTVVIPRTTKKNTEIRLVLN